MAVNVALIKEGYSTLYADENVMKANGTCTLLQDDKVNVLVDTLTAWDKDFLITELQKKDLRCDDIQYVVCTHGHSDHIGNLNLFLKATHVVGQSVSQGEKYFLHPFHETYPYVITENIKVIPTPGHTLSDVSVVVKNSQFGTVVVAGDLFENERDIGDSKIWKYTAGSDNPTLQFENREKILNMADYIIPGHGPMFRVTDELKKQHKFEN